MPCSDGYPSHGTYEDPETKRRLDRATRVACDVLSTISSSQIKLMSRDTQLWWQEHQEVDQRRRDREKEAANKERLKRIAKAKLTPEERRALGL